MIYMYALGGRSIHIDSVADITRRCRSIRLCRSDFSEVMETYGLDYGTLCKHKITSWQAMLCEAIRLRNLGRHDRFVHRIRHGVNCCKIRQNGVLRCRCDCSKLYCTSALEINLLATCRAIYNEAALLPYCWNTFVFPIPGLLDDFVGRALSTQQAAALRRIQITIPSSNAMPWPVPWADSEIKYASLVTQTAARSLSGVRNMQLYFRSQGGPSAEAHAWMIPVLQNLDTVCVVIGPSRTTSREERMRRAKLLEHAILRKEFTYYRWYANGLILYRRPRPDRIDEIRYAFGRLRLSL